MPGRFYSIYVAKAEKFDLVRAFHAHAGLLGNQTAGNEQYQGGQLGEADSMRPTKKDTITAMAHLLKNKLAELIPDPDQQFLTTQRQMPAHHPATMARLAAFRAKPGNPCLLSSLQLMDAHGAYAVLNLGFIDAKDGDDGSIWRYGSSFGKTMEGEVNPDHVETALSYLLDPDYNYTSSEVDEWADTQNPEYILRYRLAGERLFTEQHPGRTTFFITPADTLSPDFGWLVSTVRDSVSRYPICFSANAVVGTTMTDGLWMIHRGEEHGFESLEQGLGLSVSADMFNPEPFVRALEEAARSKN